MQVLSVIGFLLFTRIVLAEMFPYNSLSGSDLPSVPCKLIYMLYYTVIKARLNLQCGLDGAIQQASEVCNRGVATAIRSCIKPDYEDGNLQSCITRLLLQLDSEVCGAPEVTPYGISRKSLCSSLFHVEESLKSTTQIHCLLDDTIFLGSEECSDSQRLEECIKVLATNSVCESQPSEDGRNCRKERRVQCAIL